MDEREVALRLARECELEDVGIDGVPSAKQVLKRAQVYLNFLLLPPRLTRQESPSDP